VGEVTGLRIITLSLAFLFVTLSLVSVAAAEQRDSRLLQHFVTLPTGLGAEGLAIHNGHFYVATFSFTAADGTILVYNRQGSITQNITVPGFPGVGQLAFARDGTLYGVAANLNAEVGAVIRVELATGKVTTVASGFKVANGIAIDDAGDLFVTDLAASMVYKVTPAGSVSVFASGPLLAAALIPQAGFTFGTNDLAFNKNESALYVTDVGLGTVVRIGINKDGTAGKIEDFASIPTPDGIAFDVKGNIYVTSVFTNNVLIVSNDGSVNTLPLDTSQVPLNNPSNIAFLGPRMYVTNLDFSGTGTIDFATVQSPGLALEG
jgi:sugar lactone lactonase YvrE